MPYIAGYLLKLSVSLSVVYLFYVLVLRRLTFYTWNRWYLLGYSFLAFLIPFVNISPVLENNNLDKSAVLQFIPLFSKLEDGQVHHTNNGFAWWSSLLIGALTGILLMLVRFLVRYISFQRIRRSAQLMVDGGVKVYHVDKSIIPFSFGNAIFINPQLHSEEDLRQIIHHEFIHVKQKHTIDILWGELLCMLNWYNPFAWMIRKSIRQNLEFIADHKVLENGIDKKHYQYLLLKVTGAAHFSITQQFNFSSLKKRIVMMNRSRSAKIQLTRFLFLLPLVTILLLAFRQNIIEKNIARDATSSSKDEVREAFISFKYKGTADTIPRAKKSDDQGFLQKNPNVKRLSFQKAPASSGKFPVVIVQRHDGIEERYDWNDLQAREQFKKRYTSIPGIPVTTDVISIQADTTFVDASLRGPGNPYLKPPGSNLLLVIDGVVQDNSTKLNDIKPETIEKVNILKGELAVQTYGEKAKDKDGVVEVETTNWPQGFQITGHAATVSNDTVTITGRPRVTIKGRTNYPVVLYVVDGVEYSPAEMEKLNLDPNTIESITVIKNAEAVKKHGEKAKEGVIYIELKKPITLKINEPGDQEGWMDQIKKSDKPIWAVNGYTYAVSAAGSTARANGTINAVIVDDKLYTAGEANRLFKRSEFTGVGTLDAKTVLKTHGRNEPAMLLTRKGYDDSKYRTP